MTRSFRTRPLLRWLVVAFLVVQLGVPLVVLTAPRPSRFGWQMFTTHAPLPAVWIEEVDGTRTPVDAEDILVHPRPEADLSAPLAAALCGQDDIVAVVIDPLVAQSRRIACP